MHIKHVVLNPTQKLLHNFLTVNSKCDCIICLDCIESSTLGAWLLNFFSLYFGVCLVTLEVHFDLFVVYSIRVFRL